ncbi:Eco57I restriction-modification methylase domain-containing protein [Arcobacter ellisii]|nr:Eco57I restriction-modification methylase domain-containing protein [Arcobacter ellisii]AXX96342.1 type II DNA methyltransferase [Arcobacter ellisii]
MDIIEIIENNRIQATKDVEISKQKLYEQYFTPSDIANYMSNLFSNFEKENISILDAGAGVGNLGAICSLKYLNSGKNSFVSLTSIEWDKNLLEYLKGNIQEIQNKYINFHASIYNEDFYFIAQKLLTEGISFDRIIINPPYSLISKTNNEQLEILKKLDVSTPNTYSNFIELCYRLLSDKGELVAIVPRSFCNGTRFTKFRKKMLKNVKIEFIHLFESRKEVFKEYGVFQEVVIIKLTKKKIKKTKICISDKLNDNCCEKFNFDQITFKNDPYSFIHIPSKTDDLEIVNKISKLSSSLNELGLSISTGKVVEYREEYLTEEDYIENARILYQRHVRSDEIDLSVYNPSKPFLKQNEITKKKMIPKGNYIIIKRMSYKENKKRINTGILKKEHFDRTHMTVENHLNYIHKDSCGLDENLIYGLNAYLNLEIVDKYVRRFSGHTQINASDICSLPMPNIEVLKKVGEKIMNKKNNDYSIEELFFNK